MGMERSDDSMAIQRRRREMFTEYPITIMFRSTFAAGIPKDPNVLLAFLEARAPARPPEDAVPIEELAERVAQEVGATEGAEEAITTTFKRDEKGLYYEARCVRSHLADCARVLGPQLEIRNPKSRFKDNVEVVPEKLHLSRNGIPVGETDSREVRPITVMTRQGPRVAVKIVEVVEPPSTLEFTLVVLDERVWSPKVVHDLLTYGGMIKGMGQDRTMGFGRYTHSCPGCA